MSPGKVMIIIINNNLTNSYWSIGSTMNVKEDRAQTREMLLYKLASPRTAFFLASICHAITDPPVTKIRLWASFGV